MVEALYAPNGSYEAAEDRKLIRSIFRADGSGGVISGMQLTPGQGLQVVIAPGFFIVNDAEGGAFLGYITTSQTVSIDANTSGTTRSDTVYATVNPTTGAVTFNKATGSSVIPANSTQLGRANVPSGAQSLASSAIVNNPTPVSLGGHADARYLRRDIADTLFAGTTVAQGPSLGGSALQVATKGYVDNLTGYVDLYGSGGALTSLGSIGKAPSTAKFFIQAGTSVGRSDQSGYTRLVFPRPFPNGVLTWVATPGDGFVNNDMVIEGDVSGSWGFANHADESRTLNVPDWAFIVYRIWGPNGGRPNIDYGRVILTSFLHRINWIAVGW